jgi:uncharacterized protein DUF6348
VLGSEVHLSLAAACIGSVASHLRARTGDCGSPRDGALVVPSLHMEVHAGEVEASGSDGQRSVRVVFDARTLGPAEAGICVLAIGLGSTDEEAAADAGHQWATGVAPVLLSYLLPAKPLPEVRKSPMIVGVADSEERYGWTVHLGPVLARLYGPPGAAEPDRGDLSPEGAYRPVFDVLHPFAAHRGLMWVESFAVRFPDDRVDATARLHNRDWPEGREALLAWADSWPDTKPFALSKRQFILLEPTPLDRLSSADFLAGRLEQEMRNKRRPWWRRFVGGA